MAAVLEKSAHGRGECFEGRGRSQSGEPRGFPTPTPISSNCCRQSFCKNANLITSFLCLKSFGDSATHRGTRRRPRCKAHATFPRLAVQPPLPPLPGLLRKAWLLPAHGFSPAVARTALCAARPPRSSVNARFRATCSGPPPCSGTLAPPPAEACPLSWLRLPRHPPPLLPPMLLSSTFSVARKH